MPRPKTSRAARSTARPKTQQLQLRVIVVDTIPGVQLRVQDKKGGLSEPAVMTKSATSFDVPVEVRLSGGKEPPDFAGPFVHGPRGGRFIYVNSGTLAGQPDSCWTRRAKVHLAEVSSKLIQQVLNGKAPRLEARMAGRGSDGGPTCATVKLLNGWTIGR